MTLLHPKGTDAQIDLETDRSLESGVRTALDLPNRAEFRRLVQELLASNKVRLASDPKLAEVMQSLEN